MSSDTPRPPDALQWAMHPRFRLRSAHAITRGFTPLGDLNMYFERAGRGRPLVLLHAGFSTIESSFGKLRPAFLRDWETIAFEQQGHGHTADIARPLSYEQMMHDTAAALTKLNLRGADVFGWSDGGVIALGLATLCPPLVRKVAICGAGFNTEAEPPEFHERMRALQPDNEHLADFRQAYARVAPDPARWPTLVGKVRDMYLDFKGWSEAGLRQLAAPLLVMRGDQDFVTLEHAVQLQRLVPHGRLAVLPGTDHSAPVTRVEWVRAMLLDFFAAD